MHLADRGRGTSARFLHFPRVFLLAPVIGGHDRKTAGLVRVPACLQRGSVPLAGPLSRAMFNVRHGTESLDGNFQPKLDHAMQRYFPFAVMIGMLILGASLYVINDGHNRLPDRAVGYQP